MSYSEPYIIATLVGQKSLNIGSFMWFNLTVDWGLQRS